MKKQPDDSHSFRVNSDTLPIPSFQQIDCQVIHGVSRATNARWRIRIPELGGNQAYADRLERLVAALYFVADVRVNAAARSLIVEYSLDDVTLEEAAHRLVKVINQAAFRFPVGRRSQFQ